MYYVGYMDSLQSKYPHFVSPAGSSKMKYITDVLYECGIDVHIISMARPLLPGVNFCKSEIIEISKGQDLFYLPFITSDIVFFRKISVICQMFYLLLYILFKVHRNDIVTVYHSLSYASIMILLKKIIGFKLILEVEEIYSDVKNVMYINSLAEKKLFSLADAFFFPTEMLDEKVNNRKKPSLIIYGNYNASEIVSEKMKDGKIHVVYSGTFNERKGGVFSAINAAKYLNSNFHIHITGYGTENEIENVKKNINDVLQGNSCSLSYDGFISEMEFNSYIQKFNIGLCTQNPDDILSSSCFPSKILLYMSNGLTVLSSKAPAVVNSRLASKIFFYEMKDPVFIAQRIKEIPLDVDSRLVVSGLDLQCKKQMKKFLSLI